MPSTIPHRPVPCTISHRPAPCAVPQTPAPCAVPQPPGALRGPSQVVLARRRALSRTCQAVARRRLRCAPSIAACVARCRSDTACSRWTPLLRAVARHSLRALSPPGTLRQLSPSALRCPSQSAMRHPRLALSLFFQVPGTVLHPAPLANSRQSHPTHLGAADDAHHANALVLADRGCRCRC